MRPPSALLPLAALIALAPLARHARSAEPDYQWNLPKGFPIPYVPPDSPMTAAKVELGRYLFYDARMSVNGKASCATCHKQELAFTDGRATGLGATGESHTRGAMSLVNVAYSGSLTWVDQRLSRLEDQALVPMFGDHPIELGLAQGAPAFIGTIRADAKYRSLFTAAFAQDADPFTIPNVTRAIASFERSIVSARSPYDRYHYGGDDSAVSESAKQGEKLFFNQHLHCFRCHGGFNFSDATVSEQNADRRIAFHNTAVNLASNDTAKFKTPTLRNIAVTAPYMHDGSIPTLDAVIDHYAAGGRAHSNPNKDPLIGGFEISAEDRKNLIAFLETLTDRELLRDPRFADPRK